MGGRSRTLGRSISAGERYSCLNGTHAQIRVPCMWVPRVSRWTRRPSRTGSSAFLTIRTPVGYWPTFLRATAVWGRY